MPNIQHWPIPLHGRNPAVQNVRLTRTGIANYLLQDWLPSFAIQRSANMFGWLQHVIEPVSLSGTDFWVVDARLSRTERQWKGVLSWMLGVAGARHVLVRDGYRWIAPVSAFLPNAPIVDLARWPRSYPPSILSIHRVHTTGVRLLPDYIAIRAGGVHRPTDWALAEAKGTSKALDPSSYRRCPPGWRRQARHGRVEVRGATVAIARRMVVATRINPEGASDAERVVQTRAWNSAVQVPPPPEEAAVEVAAAHLFGLCLNLGMHRNASALALAVERRNAEEAEEAPFLSGIANEMNAAADRELDRAFALRRSERELDLISGFRPLRRFTEESPLEEEGFVVDVSTAVIALIQALRTPFYSEGIRALRSTDEQLDALEAEMRDSEVREETSITGIRVRSVEAIR